MLDEEDDENTTGLVMRDMGKREHVLLPKPRSMFILVRCSNCNAERVVYSHSTTRIRCRQCNSLLLEPTGGRAIIHAVEVKRFV